MTLGDLAKKAKEFLVGTTLPGMAYNAYQSYKNPQTQQAYRQVGQFANQNILQPMKRAGAGLADVVERYPLSPIGGIQNSYGGIREVFKGNPNLSRSDRYKQGIAYMQARPTHWENVSGQQLANPGGGINWEAGRRFITDAASAPTYFYAGTKGFLGKPAGNLLSRIAFRTTAAVPEAGINSALQLGGAGINPLKQPGDAAKAFGGNVLAMALFSNILGEGARTSKMKPIADTLAADKKMYVDYDINNPEIVSKIQPGRIQDVYQKLKLAGFTQDAERFLKLANSQKFKTWDELVKGLRKDMSFVELPQPGMSIKDVSGGAPTPKQDLGLNDLKISTSANRIPLKDKAASFITKIKSEYANRFEPIDQLVKGKNLAPSKNPSVLLKRFSGGMGIANAKIDDELAPIIQQTKNFDGLRQFLVAERSNELAGRGIAQRADKALSELAQKYGPDEMANFQKIAGQLYDYQKGQLQQLVDIGALSPRQFADITRLNQKYAPFNRVMDELDKGGFAGKAKDINVRSAGIKAIKGSEREIIDPLESMIKNTYDVTRTVEKQRVLNSLVDLGEFKQIAGKGNMFEPTAPHITLLKDGKKVFYETSKEIADTIVGLNEENLNIAIRAMAMPARIMRAGATGVNVGFAIPNVLRDQLSAAVNNKYGGVPIYDFLSGLSSVIKRDKFYKDWILSGADQASFFSQDRTMLQRSVGDITGGTLRKVGKYVKNPLEILRAFGEFSEEGSRVGVFKRSLKGAAKEGLTGFDQKLAAMEQAREATIDFARRGSKMKAFNAIIPFLNARMQGGLKLVSSFKQRPVQTMAIGGAIASVPAMTLYAYNSQFPEFDEIPDYIKDTNFVMMTGNKDTPFVKIPKGEIGQIFGNPVESFMAYMRNKDSKGFGELVLQMLGNLSPINGPGDLIPTAVKPPIEIMANYDTFRERNIVSPYQKDLPPELQFDKKTSETAKFIGGKLGVSPAKLEHGIRGYTAGVGGQALQASDAIFFGKSPQFQNVPVIDRFLGEKKDLSNTAQSIYEQSEKDKIESARRNYRIKEQLRRGETPDFTGLSKQQITSLKRGVMEDQLTEDLTPTQKALNSLSQAALLDMAVSRPELLTDISVVLNMKKQLKSDSNTVDDKQASSKKSKTKKTSAKKGRAPKKIAFSVGKIRTPKPIKIKTIKLKLSEATLKVPKPAKSKKYAFKVRRIKLATPKSLKVAKQLA